MLDENIEVEQRWNNYIKRWYEDKGYIFTKRNDCFNVKIKDLPTNSKTRINPCCDYCGKIYETSYAVYLQGHKIINKDCCPHCTGKKTSEVTWHKRAMKYMSEAQKRCEELGYVLITPVEEYTSVKMKIKIDIGNNNIQEVYLDNLLKGHDCLVNSYENRNYKRLSKEEINKVITACGDEWLNSEEYTNCTERQLKIKCKCGNVFQTSFVNFSRAGINRCPTCTKKISKGELLIKHILHEYNIMYIYQYRFDDCKDKRTLPFDFYLPDYNSCIEFDGQYHFFPIISEEILKQTIKHDNIKNKYCKDNNIPLLRIPYYESDSAEEKILQFINI